MPLRGSPGVFKRVTRLSWAALFCVELPLKNKRRISRTIVHLEIMRHDAPYTTAIVQRYANRTTAVLPAILLYYLLSKESAGVLWLLSDSS